MLRIKVSAKWGKSKQFITGLHVSMWEYCQYIFYLIKIISRCLSQLWCVIQSGSCGGVKGVALTVREVSGAEGLVSDTISWMASLSLSLCSGLLMPISLWISVSDSADMMAPLFTLARQAATYHAGMPTHSCGTGERNIFVNGTIIVIIVITEQWSVFIISVIFLGVITVIIIITIMVAWCVCVCVRSSTSSQETTVGPSHWANGRPFLRASSKSSCLTVRGRKELMIYGTYSIEQMKDQILDYSQFLSV